MVKIKNLQRKIKLKSAIIKNIAAQVLEMEGLEDSELSLVLVSDKQIAAINRDYLKVQGPTDVIAFRMADGQYKQLNTYLLGDVIISVETAQTQADKLGRGIGRELCLYLVHGILHLNSYDDREKGNKKKMFARQRKIMSKISKNDIKNI